MGNVCSISIPLDGLVSGGWNCITAPACYVCKLQNNFHSLKTAMEELTDLKNDVKRRVRVADEEQLTPLDQVQRWISRVEAAEVEINEVLEGGAREIEKLCLGGCCSTNCRSSYSFGKKVAQKLEYVASLKRDGVFEVVADRAPLALVDPKPSEPTVGMESMFDKIWSCLGQEHVGIVGLFGLGGVGKTTLLTQINNQFLNTPSDFDFVIWVVVSKDLNLEKIQDDIWKRIGPVNNNWNLNDRYEKASEIFKVLSKKKFVLLLDDIWEGVDLKKVGIPLPNSINKSKLVFTTRSKEVCGLMGAHKKIEVECLLWEKAWELFQEKVGDEALGRHPNIPKLAQIVAKECAGLPLALITIGRAMACKNTIEEWEYAIDILRNSASSFSGMEDKVFARLKFSFDNLQNDTYRSSFLYCALFPEDYVIDKSHLIDYWIGEGFLGEHNNLNRARNEGHHIIGTLLNACLLEDEKEHVKMHDVIRDMALWIVCGNGKENYFLVQAGTGLTKALEIVKWGGAKRISLMNNRIKELAITPLCSNLTTLFLNNNNLKIISDGVFDQMPNLLVLDLSSNEEIKEVPVGISRLVSLQYLNLSNTGIAKLPIQLRSLVNLKYLNLENIMELYLMPVNLISCFSKLQVCIMTGCGPVHMKSGDNRDFFFGNEGLMEELESLKDLEDLRIDIRNASSLEKYYSSKKLQRCTRHLYLKFIDGLISLNVSSLKNLNSLDSLTISYIHSLEEFEIDVERDETPASEDLHLSMIRSKSFFHSLRHVSVTYCDRLRELTWLVYAPNIISLHIFSCLGMKEVLNVKKVAEYSKTEANLNLFSSLEILSLKLLPRLESIYPNALNFPFLKNIKVIDCPQLKKLPLNSKSGKGHKIIIEGQVEWWVNLHWEDRVTQNTFRNSFKHK